MKGLFTAFRKDKTSIKANGSWLFYLLTSIVFIAIIILLFGHFYTEDEITSANTTVGKWHDTSATGKVKIDKWVWNKDKNTMDIVVQYKDDNNNSDEINRSYNMIPNNTPNKTVDYKIITQTDNKQAIRIYDVKKGFEVMVVKIFEQSKESSGEKEEVTKLLGNEKKVQISNNKKDMSKSDYQLQFVENDIEDAKKYKVNLQKSKSKIEDEISKTRDNINELESDKSYQTGTEKAETDSKIESKKTDIDSYKSEINDTENEIKQAEDKVKLLRQKYKDTQKYTE